MGPVILAAGLLFGLLAVLTKKAAAREDGSPATAAAPPDMKKAVSAVVETNNPAKILQAAQLAKQDGQHELAAGLVKEAKNKAVTHGTLYPSPWPDVPAAAWSGFVRGMKGKDSKAITPGYTLGLFNFGMRRLVDLGLASNPHKGDYKGKTVWLADWVPALSPGPDKFLDDAHAQYQALGKSMKLYGDQIKKEIPEVIGSVLDGKPVTMSGLLAVAHRAGWQGLKDWLGDASVRAAHKQSTDAFNKLNGLF